MPAQPIVPWNHNSTVVESASISGDDSPHGLVFYVPEGDAMQAGFIGDTCFSATFPCVSEAGKLPGVHSAGSHGLAGRLDVRTAGYQLHEWMHTESRHQPFNDFAICFVVDLGASPASRVPTAEPRPQTPTRCVLTVFRWPTGWVPSIIRSSTRAPQE